MYTLRNYYGFPYESFIFKSATIVSFIAKKKFMSELDANAERKKEENLRYRNFHA